MQLYEGKEITFMLRNFSAIHPPIKTSGLLAGYINIISFSSNNDE
ncbi:MAG: hypothetical protein ACXADA_12405 [Candidatus Hodarchaeales archaeon]